MDALDLLEEQHRDVSDLLARIATEPSPGARTRLVAKVVRAIDAHTRSEERHFYPACAERMTDHERLYGACEQQALARFAAQNLVQTRVTDVRFETRLQLVRELFARHAEEQEHDMFPTAKRRLTDEQLDIIGGDLERTFARLLELDERDGGPPVRRRAPPSTPRPRRMASSRAPRAQATRASKAPRQVG